MQVYFYKSFGKRRNSTKRPNITNPAQYDILDCKLKEDCSEHDPVFVLNTNEFGYIYAYVPAWHKFYYTDDVTSRANSLTEYTMTEDQLASYKFNIGATNARILYCSNGYDKMIIDSRIQVKSNRNISMASGAVPVVSGTTGYIMTVFNTAYGNPSTGFSTSYLLSEAGMSKARLWLRQSGISSAISHYMDGQFLDAIFECYWIPYFSELISGQNPMATQTTQLVIGDSYSSQGSTPVDFDAGELYVIQGHPIISHSNVIGTGLRYTDFRKFEPYTTAAIYLPGVGTISINRNEWQASNIIVNSYIEVLNGDIKYVLETESGSIISECNSNIAARCPLGAVVTNGSGVMSGIGQTLAGAVALAGSAAAAVGSGGAAAPLAAGAAIATISGIANTVMSANQHMPSISGGNTNRLASLIPTIEYYELSVNTEDPDDASYITLHGRPYNGVNTISIAAGVVSPCYIQCIDAHVDPSASDTAFGIVTYPTLREQEEINNYLNTGFYFE